MGATIPQKIVRFLKLYIPMLITQFALFGGNFVGVFLTGQYSTEHLAGMSVSFNLFSMTFTTMIGVLYGITPIISQLLGANKIDKIRTIVQHGIYLSVTIAITLFLLGLVVMDPFLQMMHLDPLAHWVALRYIFVIGCSLVPFFTLATMRNVVDAHGYTHYSMCIIMMAFVINVTCNYLLIFGRFGLPELGGVGAAVSSGISAWFSLSCYIFVLTKMKPFKRYKMFKKWESFDFTYWREQLHIGVPVGIAIFCEVSIFAFATFAMTQYGTFIIAAHQSAYSFVNLFFSFPLTISLASTICVAYEVGRGSYKGAKTYAYIARILALLIAFLFTAFSSMHLSEIAHLYTRDIAMVEKIQSFLVYALCFSIIDAFGTPIQGILRGYKDVRIISVIAVSCYWGVGIPTAYICSKLLGYGPYGIWMGLLIGVGSAGVLYILRLFLQERKYARLYSES